MRHCSTTLRPSLPFTAATLLMVHWLPSSATNDLASSLILPARSTLLGDAPEGRMPSPGGMAVPEAVSSEASSIAAVACTRIFISNPLHPELRARKVPDAVERNFFSVGLEIQSNDRGH